MPLIPVCFDAYHNDLKFLFKEEDVDLVTVYTDIYNMRIELEKMKKPIGTRESPARSCKDLFHGHPQLKDGRKHFQRVGHGNLWGGV